MNCRWLDCELRLVPFDRVTFGSFKSFGLRGSVALALSPFELGHSGSEAELTRYPCTVMAC